MIPRHKDPPADPDGAEASATATAQKTAKKPDKKPWLKPRVRTGHLFESNSLACGKSTPQLEQCNQNPATS